MNQNYEKVPNIISGKDLDYLSDMFNWNYGAYKQSLNAQNYVSDEELKTVLMKSTNTFNGTMTQILDILNHGGSNE
ncbi:MAG: hypothetical protein NC181_03050 [Clostridium sp.]|nr:hypothetical protein [Clostridium sp.]MCM1444214.1 hypothetical protein [Candidatus Amulumruptor caecigallinarius]